MATQLGAAAPHCLRLAIPAPQLLLTSTQQPLLVADVNVVLLLLCCRREAQAVLLWMLMAVPFAVSYDLLAPGWHCDPSPPCLGLHCLWPAAWYGGGAREPLLLHLNINP